MEEIVSALTVLLCWRVILSAVGSMAIAFVLSTFIAPFTVEYRMAVVILGIAVGV